MSTRQVIFLMFLILLNNLYGQWGQDTRLTYDPDSSILSSENSWCLRAQNDTIHAVWWDNRDGDWEIYYKRSTDQGMTWQSDTRLTTTLGKSQNASILSSGNYVHVVWEEESTATIHYIRSTNFGISWIADTILSLPGYYAYAPSLAINGNMVHIIWRDYDNGHLYYNRSTDNGNTWEPVIDPVSSPISSEACICASESSVHIVWHNFPIGSWIWKIYYLRSTDCGMNWDSVRVIHEGDYQSPIRKPRPWAQGDTVHIIWDESIYIYYMHSINNGSNWTAPQMLSSFSTDARSPCVVAHDSIVHAAWDGLCDDTSGIYYRKSSNVGSSWLPEITLSKSSGNAICPYISFSDSALHMIWQDNRDSNWEIYYKNCQLMESINEKMTSNVTNGFQNGIISVYPIPSRTRLRLSYKIEAGDGMAEIWIYDLNGERVKCLVDDDRQPGDYAAVWDGKDEGNSAVSSGVYFCVLMVDGKIKCNRKLLVLH